MLILGGSRERELAACREWARGSRVVLLSSGSLPHRELSAAVDRATGGLVESVVDRSALDTVTNFTSVAPILAAAGVTSVVVATESAHALRARTAARLKQERSSARFGGWSSVDRVAPVAGIVGLIVLSRYGIRAAMRTVDVSDAKSVAPEGCWRVLRDALRAVLWSVTGFDGRSLAARAHPRRADDVRAWRRDGAQDYSQWLAAALRLRLRSLRPSDAAAWARYVAAHGGEDGGSTLYRSGLRAEAHAALSCTELSDRLAVEARDEHLSADSVPHTVLLAEEVATGAFVGHVAIRHRLTASLEVRGNHIDYVCAPPHRGRGHATDMLALALPVARTLTGRDELRVDCDEANAASRRVIEKNGGRLVARGEAHDGRRAYTALYFLCAAPAIRDG
jgi:predicted acetyltransferase